MSSQTPPGRSKKIVTIGGGSGQFVLLSSLRRIPSISITAVVSMMDSGGSTGRLRDELGTLPPGDILKCVVALSRYPERARQILQKRFRGDRRLKGHNAGNMLLTMLSRYTGSFPAGVNALAEILDARGVILPVTTDQATLVAELTDGTRIFGEQAIDLPRGHQREKIRQVFLVPHHSDSIQVYPPVVKAINTAHVVILGPGDLFTSIVPNLIVDGVAKALRETPAQLLYVLNIMTKYGETHQFQAMDFVAQLESVIGRTIDGVIYNSRYPKQSNTAAYKLQKSEPVVVDAQQPGWSPRKLYAHDLLDEKKTIIRHSAAKLAQVLQAIIEREKP